MLPRTAKERRFMVHTTRLITDRSCVSYWSCEQRRSVSHTRASLLGGRLGGTRTSALTAVAYFENEGVGIVIVIMSVIIDHTFPARYSILS